jgi:pyruvate dehydrogenase E2 component (dihydrolipoamide acetyltransferase)
MDWGKVIEWRVAVGDTVHRGDVMAVVETEKSDIDIEIWHDGVVDEFLVEPGVQLDVGTPIVRLRVLEGGEVPAPEVAPRAPAEDTPPAPAPPTTAGPSTAVPPPTRVGTRTVVRASPRARQLAAERGIRLDEVVGSGPDGVVVAADVAEAAPAAKAPAAPPATDGTATPKDPTSTMRALIADRMAKANREIPHYHVTRDVDLDPLSAWLDEINRDRPIAARLLPAAAYVRAVAMTVAQHPELNGFWLEDRFVPGEGINVAMAVSLRKGGLVTPHVADAEQRSLDEIMARLNELVAAARRGQLKASWMTGSTITLTSLGDIGADLVHGVISPPQVALVGIGRSRRVPWVVTDGDDETVSIRTVATVSLAADHRATDGAIGARFLATLARLLEHPEEL